MQLRREIDERSLRHKLMQIVKDNSTRCMLPKGTIHYLIKITIVPTQIIDAEAVYHPPVSEEFVTPTCNRIRILQG